METNAKTIQAGEASIRHGVRPWYNKIIHWFQRFQKDAWLSGIQCQLDVTQDSCSYFSVFWADHYVQLDQLVLLKELENKAFKHQLKYIKIDS